jgi:hypothetical protein
LKAVTYAFSPGYRENAEEEEEEIPGAADMGLACRSLEVNTWVAYFIAINLLWTRVAILEELRK